MKAKRMVELMDIYALKDIKKDGGKMKELGNALCPKCKKVFNAEEWEDGNCPRCSLKYTWDEIYDGESEYIVMVWN